MKGILIPASISASEAMSYVNMSPPSMREQDEDDYLSDFEEAQSISGSNIDPAKLAMLLRIKFGAGTYDIHVSTGHLACITTNTFFKS